MSGGRLAFDQRGQVLVPAGHAFKAGLELQAPANQATGFVPMTEDGFVAGEVKVPEPVVPCGRWCGEQGLTAFGDPIEFEQAAAPGDEPLDGGVGAPAELGVGLGGLLPSAELLEHDGA